MSSRRDHPRSRGEYAIPPCWLAHPDGSSPLSRGIQLILVTPQINERIIPALAGNTRGLPAPPEPHQDHPRSRGEYVWVARTDMPPLGSSPLSRGIRRSVPAWLDVHGIIPALAGNTTGSLPPSFSPEDHPRSRGEYNHEGPGMRNGIGSSPLSRGIHLLTRDFISRTCRVLGTPSSHISASRSHSPHVCDGRPPGGASRLARHLKDLDGPSGSAPRSRLVPMDHPMSGRTYPARSWRGTP